MREVRAEQGHGGRLLFGLGVSAILVAACSTAPARDGSPETDERDGAGLDAAELGACWSTDGPGEVSDFEPVESLLSNVDEWIEIRDDDSIEANGDESDQEGFLEVALSSGPLDVLVRDEVLARTQRAQAAGATVHVAVFADLPVTSLAVASDEASGGIAFLDNCSHVRSTLVVDEYAASLGESPAEVFERLRTKPDELVEFLHPNAGESLAWEELDPSERVLDIELAPEHVVAEAREVVFVLDPAPADGLDSYNLCGRTTVAWSDCINLGIGSVVPLSLLTVPGQDFEFWIREDTAQPAGGTFVGTLPADELDQAIEAGEFIRMTEVGPGALREAIESGSPGTDALTFERLASERLPDLLG